VADAGELAFQARTYGRGFGSLWKIQGNRFHYAARQLSETGQQNIRILRKWAHSKGWVCGRFPAGTPERWGIYRGGEFEWRLRIKPEATFRPRIDPGSNVPRFDARFGKGGASYVNPFTGEVGLENVGAHLPLEQAY